MPISLTTNSIGPGIRGNLGATAGESLIVAPGVVVWSTDAKTISGTGSGQKVSIQGYVAALSRTAVYMGGDGGLVNVGSTGIVEGLENYLDNIGTAVIFMALGGVVANDGIIRGDWTIFINADGIVHNNGVIDSYQFAAIEIAGAGNIINSGTLRAAGNKTVSVSGTMNLANSGTIFGNVVSLSGSDTMTNTGQVIGAVALGSNNDTYDGRNGIVTGLVQGEDGNDTLLGGNSFDNFDGGLNDDRLETGAGNDYLHGNQGVDHLDAGAGDDHLWGGAGADEHWGGDGLDYARYDDANHGSVTASLANSLFNTSAALGDTYFNIEGLVGGAASDTLYGDSGVNYLFGGDGADQIFGGDGNDLLFGDSTGLNGASSGGDNLWGGQGADRHFGGDGTDYARYDDANYGNLIISLSDPTTNTSSATGDTYVSIEGLVGGLGADVIIGNNSANFLFGGDGADFIDGLGGADYLNGGAAADRFRFSTTLGGGNVDNIADFTHLSDDILLTASIFSSIGATLDATELRQGAAAVDANDFIIYNSATGALSYDGDGSGAAAAVQFATVTAGTTLSFDDFVIV